MEFISKVRALTKQYKKLPFAEKYPIHALEIEQAAKQGNNYYLIPCGCLARFEKEDLEREGFKVEQYNALEYKISW